jgi:hypothetical protein
MSEELATNISWSPLLEAYFQKVAEKAQCYCWLYNHAEQTYSRRRTYIDIPSNIIASLTGFLSVGSTTIFENETKLASIALGIASLIVSIMNSTKSYFALDKKAEGCRISSISYAKLYRTISIELGLPQLQRMRANDMLKMTKNEVDRLQETSYPVCFESIEAFKKKFSISKYDEISKPEVANGLEKVEVYVEGEKS